MAVQMFYKGAEYNCTQEFYKGTSVPEVYFKGGHYKYLNNPDPITETLRKGFATVRNNSGYKIYQASSPQALDENFVYYRLTLGGSQDYYVAFALFTIGTSTPLNNAVQYIASKGASSGHTLGNVYLAFSSGTADITVSASSGTITYLKNQWHFAQYNPSSGKYIKETIAKSDNQPTFEELYTQASLIQQASYYSSVFGTTPIYKDISTQTQLNNVKTSANVNKIIVVGEATP